MTTTFRFALPATLMVASVALATLAIGDRASAQIPPPAGLIYGSITDSAGDVAADLPVHAYVGDVECTSGSHVTHRTPGADGEDITVYSVDLFAAGQREGCAGVGSEVRIEIGDRMAPGSVTITEEIVYRFDATFGDATPVVIPTFTPTPPGESAAPETPATDATPPATPSGPDATSTTADDDDGENDEDTGSETDTGDDEGEGDGDGTATTDDSDDATSDSGDDPDSGDGTPSADADDDDGGTPGWALAAGIGAAAVVAAGGIGGVMYLRRGGA